MLLTKEEWHKVLIENTVYQVITGSTSYGLDREGSDVDEKAIVILPKKHFFTLGKDFETETMHEPKDMEFHTLKKTFNMLKNQNPTIKEMIWTPEKFVVKNSKYGQALRDNKQLFLSSKVYDSFGGYARQQLMRIKGGLDRLTEQDKIEHLSFTLDRLIESFPKKYTQVADGTILVNDVFTMDNGKQNANLQVHFDNISLTQINGVFSELNQTLTTYNKMGNRNRKPQDKLTKHAMHLLRLMITAIELLTTGQLNVYREEDRKFLLSIRDGEMTWEDFFALVAEYQVKLANALKHTVLPPDIDEDRIEELYTDLMIDWFTAA